MTAEKHPLNLVRDRLEYLEGWQAKDGDSVVPEIATEALNILNTYLCQTQSCAECERLGMENALLRYAVMDFGAVCGGVDDWGDKLAAVQEKHAATIAAAGGE